MTKIGLIFVVDEIVVELNPLSPFLKTTLTSLIGSLYYVRTRERNEGQIPFDAHSSFRDFTSGYVNVREEKRHEM